jgi:hypothetical protein
MFTDAGFAANIYLVMRATNYGPDPLPGLFPQQIQTVRLS